MQLTDKIYRASPVPLQHLLVSAYGIYWKHRRFGGNYRQFVDAFRRRDRWLREEWSALQNDLLRQLLRRALRSVPHYQEAWRGILSEDQVERFTVQDLPSLPPLEKETVRRDPHSLLIGGKPRRDQRPYHTSGSSGTPLAIYMNRSDLRRGLAVREVRSLGPAGVSFRLPRATFSGRIVVPETSTKGPVHRFNRAEGQVYFSAFHLGPETFERYLEALHRHRIQWLTGYSHSAFELASLALAAGLRPGREIPGLKAVVTTSEAVTPSMRRTIERAFDTRVYEEYGSVENTFFASENEHSELLLSPDYGVLETVDGDGRPQPADTPGEVLSTGFAVEGHLFVRLRIGDVATLSSRPPSCGRQMPVIREIVGRLEDVVYGPDGRRMVRFHGVFVDQPNVARGQIVQQSLDRVLVRVQPTPEFDEPDRHSLVQRVQQRLGPKVHVEVETTDQLDRSANGKLRSVISRLSAEEISQLESRPATSDRVPFQDMDASASRAEEAASRPTDP